MRRRRLLLRVAAGTCLGLAGFGFVWLASPRPGITRENYERIRVGMPKSEVEAILGGAFMPVRRGPEEPKATDYAYCQVWSGEELDVWVYFGHDDRVIRSTCDPDVSHSWVDRLRRLLPW